MPALLHAGNLSGPYRWSSGCHETDNYKESISGRWLCLWYATRGILYYFFLQYLLREQSCSLVYHYETLDTSFTGNRTHYNDMAC